MDTVPSAYETETVDDRRLELRNHISWGAVLAGVAAALVVQIVLSLLGVGLGAASLSVGDVAANPSASSASTTAALWWVASGIIASFFGGLVAGRLCGAGNRNTAGWHGFVSWAASTLLVVFLLSTAVGSIVGGAAGAFGSMLSGAGKTAAAAAGGVAQATDGDALQAQVRRLVNPNDAQNVQDSVIGYIRASASGDQKAADAARDRAVDGLAKTANISPDEARNRLNQAEQEYKTALDQAKQKAADAAEATRKGVASAGLFGTAALLLGAIFAGIGGLAGAPRRIYDARVVTVRSTSSAV